MNGLRLKDRPWMWAMIVLGAVAMALALLDRSFLHVFLLGPNRLEVLFAVSACAGLLLGAIAVLWDDMLGTREFLLHRPVERRAMAMSPMIACAYVLAIWTVTVPFLAWFFWLFDGRFVWTFWPGVPAILATSTTAWTACGVGCAAASLPAPWWVRVMFAGTLVVLFGSGIDQLSQVEENKSSMLLFLALNAVATALLAGAAVHFQSIRRDSDRAWQPRTRRIAGVLLVASTAYTLAGVAGEMQSQAVYSLFREYPSVVKVDGSVALALRTSEWNQRILCDENHQVVGDPRPRTDFDSVACRRPLIGGVLEIEPPRWHRGGMSESLRGTMMNVLIDPRGNGWLHSYDDGVLKRTGIGPELSPFPSGINLDRVNDVTPNVSWVAVGDRESGTVWRFDVDKGYFVELPMPEGDRFRGFHSLDSERAHRGGREQPLLAMLLEKDTWLHCIYGDNGSYILKDGALAKFELEPDARPEQLTTGELIGADPISFGVEVKATDELAAFRHEFTPRTMLERLHATHAFAWSLLRPPVLQLGSFAFAGEESRASVFTDRLVANGNRWWLLLLCVGVGAYSAWCVRRRLTRLGAERSAIQFWTIAAALCGPVGAYLSLVCEPGRAYRRPALPKPAAPFITSNPTREEISA